MDTIIVLNATYKEKFEILRLIAVYICAILRYIRNTDDTFNWLTINTSTAKIMEEADTLLKKVEGLFGYYQMITQKHIEENDLPNYNQKTITNNIKNKQEECMKSLISFTETLNTWNSFNLFASKNNPPEVVKWVTEEVARHEIAVTNNFPSVIKAYSKKFNAPFPMSSYVVDNDTQSICSNCKSDKILLNRESSHMVCSECYTLVKLTAVAYEEEHLHTENVNYTKQKNHNELSHAKKWLTFILGSIDVKIPTEDLTAIFNAISGDYRVLNGYVNFEELSCEKVRATLKKIGKTSYNKYVVYLRAKITEMMGKRIDPPAFTEQEKETLMQEFDKILHALKTVLSSNNPVIKKVAGNMSNNKYYPFFWYKIFQVRLKKSARLQALLKCIHIQREATNKKNEVIWSEMIKLDALKKDYS